jgi:DNA polymerase-3 subunit alpha
MIPLHIHTEYSLLDGGIKIKDLFKYVKSLGFDAIGISEHGNLGGTIKKYKLAKKEGVKLIIGCELYVVKDMSVKEKGDKRSHIVLYAKDQKGYHNLIKIVSAGACEGFYYKPRVDKDLIRKYSGGLVCTTACMQNDIAQAVLMGDIDLARYLIKDYIDIFGRENFFLEVAKHDILEEAVISEWFFKLAKEFDIRVVFGSDAHYLKEEHAHAHDVILSIGTRATLAKQDRYKFHGKNYHILSEKEARDLYSEHQEVFDNTRIIADMCNVDFEFGRPIFPDFSVPEGHTLESYLRELCYRGFEDKYEHHADKAKIKERLDYEIDVICKMGFAEYFLIIQDVIAGVSKLEKIGTAGRGSAAGSVAGYVLGIHQLEPIHLDLLFERFLNPERISLPDIDTDFADRNGAIDYVKRKYGPEKIGLIGTYGTLASKLAVKDTARVYGVSFEESNAVTKTMLESIQESYDALPDVKAFFDKYPKIKEVSEIIQDMVKFRGTHASGVVWGKLPITDYVPVYGQDGELITQYDMEELEDIGLVKFDFLGLDTMNIMRQVLEMIKRDNDWLIEIPLDDKETYDMLSRGDSLGVFQLESDGMRHVLKSIKPTVFSDIVAIVALYRPGSLDYVDVYARRKHGQEEIIYDHPKLEPILSDTYAILVYQEQVMIMSKVLAGFTGGESDTLRKAIGKKKLDLMLSMEKKFKEGCMVNSGMTRGQVDNLWDKILKFADYSFNKSHAACYALTAYRTAYLRCHYPAEFMTAMINSTLGDIDKTVFYINEAKRMRLRILAPDINNSGQSFVTEGTSIRFGLGGIKNVSGVSLESIMANRPFKSFVDFINKVDVSKVNKRVQKNLIMAGCFDALGVHRNSLMAGYDEVAPQQLSKTNETQMTLFGTTAGIVHTFPRRNEPTLYDKITMERDSMGIAASGDFLELYPDQDLGMPAQSSGRVMVFGIVKDVRRVFTKRDQKEMCFGKIYNKEGELDIVVFPNAYSVYGGAVFVDAGLLLTGNMQNGSLLVDSIEKIEPRRDVG